MQLYRKKALFFLSLLFIAVQFYVIESGSADDLPNSRYDIRPVFAREAKFHSIHSYNLTSPESPDGKWLLFFRSTTPDAHLGDVCIYSRKTGETRVLAGNVEVQDAHRVACQQWANNGRTVVYQKMQAGHSQVIAVDIKSLKESVLGNQRQVGYSPATAESVALYGEHWLPAHDGDLSLADVTNATSSEMLDSEAAMTFVRNSSKSAFFKKIYADRRVTLFFPNISPDRQRIFFKLSSPLSDDFRSRKSLGGSKRVGLVVYDLSQKKFQFVHEKWGHPAWHPDSRHIINMKGYGAELFEAETGKITTRLKQPPHLKSGGHPCVAPDGNSFVTDGKMTSPDLKGHWGIVVGSFEKKSWDLIYEFRNTRGARSWRPSHPHPAYSPDSQRIYFNVSEDKYTRMYVAEKKSL